MKSLKLEAEVLQISIYCHIVCQILFMHRELSLNKILPFAYLIKKERIFLKTLYSANNTKYLEDKALSILSGEYQNYCSSIEYIIKAIHLLILNKNIEFDGNILFFRSKKGYDNELYDVNSFIFHAIEESKITEDYQFLKEVVQNV